MADPELNGFCGIFVFGQRSKYVYKYVIDMDFSSMYPNIIIVFNISASTMIAKLIIDEDEIETTNKLLNALNSNKEEKDDIQDKGKEFIDNYLTGNVNSLCSKWFNLPNVGELVNGYSEKGYKQFTMSKGIGNQYFPMGVNVELED